MAYGHSTECKAASSERPEVAQAKAELLSTLAALFAHARTEGSTIYIPDDYLEEIDGLILAVQSSAEGEIAKLRDDVRVLEGWLGECYALTGADPDDNADAMLAPHAVAEVARLRREFDQLEAAEAALRSCQDAQTNDQEDARLDQPQPGSGAADLRADQWRPIETFTGDGPSMFARGELVWFAPNPRMSLAQSQRHGNPPTHWMLIPSPPSLKGGNTGVGAALPPDGEADQRRARQITILPDASSLVTPEPPV